jgi:GT2 family glycosyltransferase
LIRQLETSTSTAAATYNPAAPLGENVRVFAPDARCTLISLKRFPAHVRLRRFESWDAIVADFLLSVLPLGQGTRGVGRSIAALPPVADDPAFTQAHGRELGSLHADDPAALEAALSAAAAIPSARELVSIITLSWNAPQFTANALASIRAHTSEPYEVIVVDNGSGPETLEMLKTIDDPHVRIIYNAANRGYAGGNNDGIVAARGEYLVLLNNDVIVTEGWLDGLLWPFSKLANLGTSAPRSNRVVGPQQVHDANYDDAVGMEAFARERRERLRHRGYITDRAIGLCLCVRRRVIDEIGGFDESYGVGNFEDDDFSLRVRGAGYQIYVCDDVFIHHFGSQSFLANNVDYMATMHANWSVFAAKWGYPSEYPTQGYDPRTAIYRGFDRSVHYAALPEAR